MKFLKSVWAWMMGGSEEIQDSEALYFYGMDPKALEKKYGLNDPGEEEDARGPLKSV